MSWFSNSSRLTINLVDRLLRKIKSIDALEREYVKGLFRQFESGGITRKEVEQVIRDLRLNTSDSIDPQEAKAIEKQLLGFLK